MNNELLQGCNKIIYLNKKEAQSKINFLKNCRDRKINKLPVRTYYCKKCNGWHLTHKPFY